MSDQKEFVQAVADAEACSGDVCAASSALATEARARRTKSGRMVATKTEHVHEWWDVDGRLECLCGMYKARSSQR